MQEKIKKSKQLILCISRERQRRREDGEENREDDGRSSGNRERRQRELYEGSSLENPQKRPLRPDDTSRRCPAAARHVWRPYRIAQAIDDDPVRSAGPDRHGGTL